VNIETAAARSGETEAATVGAAAAGTAAAGAAGAGAAAAGAAAAGAAAAGAAAAGAADTGAVPTQEQQPVNMSNFCPFYNIDSSTERLSISNHCKFLPIELSVDRLSNTELHNLIFRKSIDCPPLKIGDNSLRKAQKKVVCTVRLTVKTFYMLLKI
jgi:hypothetical protein